jgi:DsbC/DsbD-like thiol-disulfide interchange protein
LIAYCNAVCLVALLLFSVISPPASRADPVVIPHGKLELVARETAVTAGKGLDIGLHFQLEPGWHIYWVNPGDSGEPPKVEWHLPSGVSAGEIEWPVPQRFQSGTVADYGYENDVLLPVPIHVGNSLAPTQLKIAANVKLLVCSHQMCIPGKANLSLTLPEAAAGHSGNPDGRTLNWFEDAEKSLPLAVPRDWKLSAIEEKDSFVVRVNLGRRTTDHPVSQATFFPLEESEIDNAALQKVVGSPEGIQMTVRKSEQLTKSVTRLSGLLVFQSGKAYSVEIPVRAAGSGSR